MFASPVTWLLAGMTVCCQLFMLTTGSCLYSLRRFEKLHRHIKEFKAVGPIRH
jgi:hypothetical protein